MILLFDKVCLFDIDKNKTIIYGQYQECYNKLQKIDINVNVKFNLVLNNDRNDFYIEIYDKINYIDEISFMNGNDIKIIKKDIVLFFPFEKCDLSLCSNSVIISTMCKDYSSRLEEWIEYNLKLGISGIVIFDNNEDGNNKIKLNEPLDYLQNNGTVSDICKKYKGKVWHVKFNYKTMDGTHWNNIQRISLHIGVNAFRNKCGKIALIDADEFIYIPKESNIVKFLSNYKGQTLTMKSNILTNKSNQDIINNNILELCLYLGENKYTKTILDTTKLKPMEFINSPHEHHTEILLDKCDIIHYHCWVNSRYKYNENMQKIEFLKDV
jgi:hypothetical protein